MKKKEYILELCKTEEGRKVLIEKFKEILSEKDLYKFDCMDKITEALLKSDEGKRTIEKYFKEITELFDYDWYNDASTNQPEDIKYLDFILKLMKDSKQYEFIVQNLYTIMQKMGNLETVDFIEYLKPETNAKLKERNIFLYQMYNDEIIFKDTLGILIKNDLNTFCEILFEELSEGKEITTLGEGGYSQVFKTNGYIIKIGKERERYEVPYHPNILQPLMKIRGLDEHGNYRYVIEVQNECNTKDVTDEDAQKIKDKLRMLGINWSDEARENIGITIRPNKRILNIGTEEEPDYFNGSYDIGAEEKELPENEIVITDVDCIDYMPSLKKDDDVER